MTRTPFALLSGGALLAAAATIMSPAIAQAEQDQQHQTDPNQPVNDGSAAASQTVAPGQVAPGYDPGTASANGTVSSSIRSTKVVNAANQAQYQSDMAAYDRAVSAHGRAIAHQDAHYMHQQQAYADAMQAWRAQDYACRHGSSRACNSPAPDPANYY
jgi:hypothetical protein